MKNLIRDAIKENHMQVSDLLQKTGFSKSYFYDVINGKINPSLRNARLLSKELKKTVDDIFPIEEENQCQED